ncbi:hypothetical protein chiPu_0004210 [Chiloscyllium punctatum]|uniref:HTH CENPB-type domain-containing protein n=1 Tax=Chiloscyllium punctatum TaxID=137246 RepID=A0A401S5Y6_CHIPU|nr:hypothetical protein [Chiloscyllium punctatum]
MSGDGNCSELVSSVAERGPASPKLTTALATVLIFTIVVDIVGNVLVIMSVFRNRKLRNAGKHCPVQKNEDLNHVLIEWIKQQRSERMPLTGLMSMKQARKYHKELNIKGECQYSEGWLQKFKKCHGVKYLKICGKKTSADHEAAESYVGEFVKLISDKSLSPEQIYNADETALYWCYVPRKTLATANERAPAGFKETKDRLTILECVNAAGTHKVKLAVFGKSKHPRSDIEEMLNIDNIVVYSLSDGNIAEMVLNRGSCTDKCEDSSGDGDDDDDDDDDDDELVTTVENVPINDMVKMCDQLIAGLEQSSFISE